METFEIYTELPKFKGKINYFVDNYIESLHTQNQSSINCNIFSEDFDLRLCINLLQICYESAKKKIKLNNNSNKNANNASKIDKYFIIKYGPPASGKSSFNKDIFKLLKLKLTEYSDINIDNICQQCLKYFKLEENEENYRNIRLSIGNKISDIILLQSYIEGRDIMWETMGSNIDWTMSLYIPLARAYDYKIIIFFPITSLPNLVTRCTLRSQIANCNEDYLKSIKVESSKNLSTLEKKVDKFIIYDNNGKLDDFNYIIYKTDDNVYSCNPKFINTNNTVNTKNEHIKNLDDYISKLCKIHKKNNNTKKKINISNNKLSSKMHLLSIGSNYT
jgi:hypothetical protein